jgi:hypothetical protein
MTAGGVPASADDRAQGQRGLLGVEDDAEGGRQHVGELLRADDPVLGGAVRAEVP